MARIISTVQQKITHDMKEKIHDAFREEYQVWKDEGQKNLSGQYTLYVCEKVEMGTDEDYISVSIEKDGQDGGYLHVHGLRECQKCES